MKARVLALDIVVVCAAAAFMSATSQAEQAVTTQSLLREMTDLNRLAEFPSPAYTTKQFSSHDPKSKSPVDHDAWFANDDFDHWLRTEENGGRTERVMMESNGPGAVVRIWSANPAGTMRVYLDGARTPAIEANMEALLGGKLPGFPAPIAGLRAKGYNLYLPIPYVRSCKITTDAKGFYYNIDYRTYGRGTEVTSFKAEDVMALAAEITQQAERLAKPMMPASKVEQLVEVRLAPGEKKLLGKFAGPLAINQFRIKLGAARSDAALRGTIIRMTFDDETTVETPLGDFFGSAPGINAFESLPLRVTKDGEMLSRWVMPFRDSATIEVENLGDVPIAFIADLGTIAYEWTANSMHFNAGYRAQYDAKTRPVSDWSYLVAKGKGVFAGVSFAIDNPTREWWGEGDEKIYVDGETQPSWFGTGTEDYYGYAWGWTGFFEHAYHAQPRCDGPRNYGRTSVNRFHIMDRIPFERTFKFDMELWHWKDVSVNMAVTTYWYAMPGSSDSYVSLTKNDLVVRPMEPYKPFVADGAIEGEKMKVIAHAGDVAPQEWADTSNDFQLLWSGKLNLADELVLGFESPKAGRYRLVGRFLRASDYGIVRLAVNDKVLGEPIDFYNADVKPSEEIDLGIVDLAAGENRLTATIVGANPKAKPLHFFGLDYVLLKPIDAP